MPEWCCESMIIPFIKCGVKVEFYSLDMRELGCKTDAILLMDYFGYSRNYQENLFDGVIIRDVTHSVFSSKYDDADYYFGSLRKWAGFWSGGYAYGLKKPVKYDFDNTRILANRKKAMEEKASYIYGESERKDYLKRFISAENELETVGILEASQRDIDAAKRLDISEIREKRRNNASVLLEEFADIAVFPNLEEEDCPMFVPIRVKERNKLRQFLIQNEIYCPIHWPISEYHKVSKEAARLYDEEISLICDQRYTSDDMLRIISTVKQFWKDYNL